MMPDGEQQLTSTSSTQQHKKAINPEYSSAWFEVLWTTMCYLGEILVVVLLALSSYASLQKGALKVQLQPPPVSLFGDNTTVRDYYGGDVARPFSTVMSSDISLVMYYAPWDFDSQLAKDEFEQVANLFKGQVFSTAINCWVHKGACRQTFPKLRTFPLVLGYIGGSKGVQYRGPLQYQYMVEFVKHLLRPLERVESLVDLYGLMTSATAVVTGYFNFNSSQPVGFYSFYVAALRYMEYDAFKSVRFATVTNPKAAARLGIRMSKPTFDIRLHLWNETLIYPHNGSSIDVNRFLQWVYYRSHSPIQWIWPSGRKSQVIQHYLIDQNRPSLILFTPKLKDSTSPMIAKEIGLDYNNCGPSPRISRLIQEIQIQRERLESIRRLSVVENQCSLSERPGVLSRSCWTASLANMSSSLSESCWVSSSTTAGTLSALSIQGLGCRTNRSLNFFLMDSDQYPNYLRKLGAVRPHEVAVIIDPVGESHYVLNQLPTRENLEWMIQNFTESNLIRFRRSVETKKSSKSACPSGRICIREITSNEFEEVVLNPSQDVMVLYRKRGCVFCDVAARVFLQLSLMLASSPEPLRKLAESPNIQLVAIDAEENDLPWQYTVDRYPAIIFYPAHRKMDSRAFPFDVELNVVNLLNFTLSRLSVRRRVSWFVHFCQDVPCLREAQWRIAARIAVIDRHIRNLRYRLLWLNHNPNRSVTEQLRSWLKERRFYQELSNAVLDAISEDVQKKRRELYPEGVAIRLAVDD